MEKDCKIIGVENPEAFAWDISAFSLEKSYEKILCS